MTRDRELNWCNYAEFLFFISQLEYVKRAFSGLSLQHKLTLRELKGFECIFMNATLIVTDFPFKNLFKGTLSLPLSPY